MIRIGLLLVWKLIRDLRVKTITVNMDFVISLNSVFDIYLFLRKRGVTENELNLVILKS